MVSALKNKNDIGEEKMQTGNSATVVDGKLIISFPAAKNPVIWQMDLNKAQSCSLEIKEDKKKKEFILKLKTDSQNSENIAAFENKEGAVECLMATSAALQNASGQINPSATASAATAMPVANMMPMQAVPVEAKKKSDSSDNKMADILTFLLITTLIVVCVVSVPKNSGPLLSTGATNNSAGNVAGSASKSGVPVSADEFLLNR